MLENYRLRRARRTNTDPLQKFSVGRSSRIFAIAAAVVAMSIIAYAICFAYRIPVLPNMLAHKGAQVHVVSTINFSYKSDFLTQQKRDLNAEKIPPSYKVSEASLKNATETKNKLAAFFNANQPAYEESVKNQKEVVFLEEISTALRKSTTIEISPADIALLYNHTDEKSRTDLFSKTTFYVRNILSDGVYQDGDKIFTESKDWLNPSANVNTSTSQHAVSETRARLELLDRIKTLGEKEKISLALYRIFLQAIVPNIEFDAEKTKEIRNAARAEIEPVVVKIREGEVLADSDSINTPIAQERLRAYKNEIIRRGEGDIGNIPRYVNFLVCVLLMVLAALFFVISRSPRTKELRTIYAFCTLLVFSLLVERSYIGMLNSESWDNSAPVLQTLIYASPLILGPVLQVLLFGSYTGFIMAIVVSSLSTLMLSESLPFFTLSLTASLVAIYMCDGATNRYRVIFAGAVYGAFVAVMVAIIGFCISNSLLTIGKQVLAAILGGITTSIVAIAVLPIIELLFKRNSNISLIDYTDLNNKKASLLRQLQIVAPGTYHHSVMVSYLAEAAAQAVRANPMICRVGALYHDIGKLSKPEFFSENQGSQNPHDDQNPSMSALIIKNHVPDGIAKAEIGKLPRQIIDAISQHHGTSIISYFYRKAKKKAEQNGVFHPSDLNQILREEGIEESTYRHEGQKPQTVENAIIMISDSCEAASRSMKKVTKHGIETMVEAIVNGKMTDGQFDECPITVKQISVIKRTVSQTLLNMLHSRVDYKQV